MFKQWFCSAKASLTGSCPSALPCWPLTHVLVWQSLSRDTNGCGALLRSWLQRGKKPQEDHFNLYHLSEMINTEGFRNDHCDLTAGPVMGSTVGGQVVDKHPFATTTHCWCSPQLFWDGSLQGSQKNGILFGQTALLNQAYSWSSLMEQLHLCVWTGMRDRGSWSIPAANACEIAPWSSAHLPHWPLKQLNASDPKETIPSLTLHKNMRLCSTLKINPFFFFQIRSTVVLCKHWEDNRSLFEFWMNHLISIYSR